MTPYEASTGHKPHIRHLRIFGCIAYAHIHDDHHRKLDAKSRKCIMVGYSEESKAYKLYDPINHKVIISRDVTFDEESKWKTSPTKEIEASTSQSSIEHVDEEE